VKTYPPIQWITVTPSDPGIPRRVRRVSRHKHRSSPNLLYSSAKGARPRHFRRRTRESDKRRQDSRGCERQEFSRGMGRDGGIRRNHGDRKRGVRGGGGRTARMNVNLVVAGLLLACRASSAFRFAPAGPSSVIARGGGSSCNGRSPVSRRSGSAGIQSACWAGGAGIFGSAKPTFQQRRWAGRRGVPTSSPTGRRISRRVCSQSCLLWWVRCASAAAPKYCVLLRCNRSSENHDMVT